MAQAKVINSWEVKPFSLDDTYDSRMLLDNIVVGEPTVQINEGTVKPGIRTGGGVHENTEIYYAVKGNAIVHLGDSAVEVRQGSLIIIPSGVFHYIENKSQTEDFILLTFWMDASQNEMYELRMKVWGKSFKTIYDD